MDLSFYSFPLVKQFVLQRSQYYNFSKEDLKVYKVAWHEIIDPITLEDLYTTHGN